MIYNKTGEMFFYEDKMFLVGEEIYATESAYCGLLGKITEIRTGEDRETDNEGPDIYCSLCHPILAKDAEMLVKLAFSNEGFTLDCVIMSPEMLIPTRTMNTGLPLMTVYAVFEDRMVNGEERKSTRLFSERIHAEIALRKSIADEKESGCISDWLSTRLYTEKQNPDMDFCAYLRNEFEFNHYTAYIKELLLPVSIPFAKEMLPVCLGIKYRRDIAEQIFPWETPERVKRTAINDPSVYARVSNALDARDLYNEEYAEAISEVAYNLVNERKKIEEILKHSKDTKNSQGRK